MKAVPTRVYYSVFTALLILLGVTVGVAYLDFGSLGPVVALTIATIKAVLVVLYFMHVRYGSRLIWIFAASGFFWLFLMIAIVMADYLTRPLLT